MGRKSNAQKAAEAAIAHAGKSANEIIADQLEAVAAKMVERLEKEYKDIRVGQLPISIAILRDKARDARGEQLALKAPTINVQINGLGKEDLRNALLGVGDLAAGRRRDGKGKQGKVGTVEIGSHLGGNKPIGEISPPGCIHPMPPATDTLPITSPLLSASDAIIELQQLAQPDPALHGPAQGHGSTADDAKQAGGEGVASGARGSDCINSQPVINISKNALDQPLPSHDSH